MQDFDNDWDQVVATPVEAFRQVPFAEVFGDAGSWDSDLNGYIMRIENQHSGKVTEKLYKKATTASKALRRYEDEGHYVTCYCKETMYSTLGITGDDDDTIDED